ncbi:MAG: LacI family DNA-binding transcriptional regulator [bacterium]
MSRIRIDDVARRLGVAKSTISKALNNRPDVSQKTKDKVRELVAKLGYKPDRLAQAFSSRRTRLIGVVIPVMKYSFFADIARSVTNEAQKSGYRVIFDSSEETAKHEAEIVNDFIERGIDGLIIAPCIKGSTSSLQKLVKKEYPFVVIDRYINGITAPFVGTDFEKGAYEATKYLIKLEHKKIGYLGGPAFIPASKERINGFKRALAEAGINIKEQLIIQGEYDPEDAGKNMQILIKRDPDITAIICANPDISTGVYEELIKREIKVPDDISLIDFGNASFFSSVDQKTEKIGKIATQILLDIIKGENFSKKIIVDTELVIRKSCAKPKQK